MSEPASAAEHDHAPPGVVEGRGTLDVRVRAIERVVEKIVRDTPGTVTHRTTLGRLTGRRTPSASVDAARDHADVSVEITCRWPGPVAATAAQVRDAVHAEATRLTGVDLRTVDVVVSVVGPEQAPDVARRVE